MKLALLAVAVLSACSHTEGPRNDARKVTDLRKTVGVSTIEPLAANASADGDLRRVSI
jgi:hypothetical protein